MQIAETKKDFEIAFKFDHSKVSAIKGIKGAWWESKRKIWHIPKYKERDVLRLCEKFNIKEIKITEYFEPDATIVDDIPVEETRGELPPLPELDIELPLLREPYHFQKQGIAYGRMNKRVLIGDQMGLGKTTEAIGIICSYGINEDRLLNAGPGLVICTASKKIDWKEEFNDVSGHRAMILRDKIIKTWPQYYTAGMCDTFIVNYESIKKYFVEPGWKKSAEEEFKVDGIPFLPSINLFKWIIIDESHNCKDGDAQRTKFVMGITRGKEIIIELTGTPILNRTEDLISQLHIIDQLRNIVSHIPYPVNSKGMKHDYAGAKRFKERYCGKNESVNVKELNYRLQKFCYIRRLKKEVLPDLPDKIRQVVRCEITNRAEYDLAKNKFKEYLTSFLGCTDKVVKRKLRAEFLVKIGYLQRISAIGKIEQATEFINEVISNGEKIVVFVHHHEIADAIKAKFPSFVTITGRDSEAERHHSEKMLANNPHTRGIICSLGAGGVGINLTAASEVLFIEFPWTFAKAEQAEDRTHRVTQKKKVRASYLLGYKTFDEYCYYEIIQKKKALSDEVNGASDDVFEEMVDKLLNIFNQK